MTKTKRQPLVVTTSHHGVFFGYGNPILNRTKTIRLENCRMCIYWCAEVKGVLGLAATGPVKGCKITFAVPAVTLNNVTSIMEASKTATVAWEKGEWS